MSIADFNLGLCVISFFPVTSVLWNSQSSYAFPAVFNLPLFKSSDCAHLKDLRKVGWVFFYSLILPSNWKGLCPWVVVKKEKNLYFLFIKQDFKRIFLFRWKLQNLFPLLQVLSTFMKRMHQIFKQVSPIQLLFEKGEV